MATDPTVIATVPAECVGCHTPMQSPAYCFGCRRLYPSDSLSIFELFGLPPRFDLSPDELREAYLRLTRAVHPDRLSAMSADDQHSGERLTARINQGYEVLGNPIRRAEYLLEFVGGPSAASDKSVPTDVLAETLEIREELDEAQARGDVAAVERIRRQAQQSFDATRGEIETLARTLPGDEATRRALRERLNTIKYYERILERT
ncbi:MAG: Fe-S protein assembly co-chaperone HscB [Phycisphaerae bacterium]